MGNLSKVVLGGAEYNIKDSQARADLNQFRLDQLCLSADQAAIAPLPTEYDNVVTTDTVFLTSKTYFKKSNDTYTQLMAGTDYVVGSKIADYGETVYEQGGWTMQDLCKKLNDCIVVFNKLIAAHAQTTSGGTQP